MASDKDIKDLGLTPVKDEDLGLIPINNDVPRVTSDKSLRVSDLLGPLSPRMMPYYKSIATGIAEGEQGIANLVGSAAGSVERGLGVKGAGTKPLQMYDTSKTEHPFIGEMAPMFIPMGEAGSAVTLGAKGLGKGLEYAKTPLSKMASPILPKMFGEKILAGLGEGRSLSENGQSLASDIKNAFEKKKLEGNKLYAPINAVEKYLSVNNGSIKTVGREYLKLLKDNPDIEKKLNAFIGDNSLENAHNFQSQLGSEIRRMEKKDVRGNLSEVDRNTMNKYRRVRNILKQDINDSLFFHDKTLPDVYENATNFWDENVSHYYENPKIARMAKGNKKGGITDPRNIPDIFKNPEEDIQKVVRDIGKDGRKKILFSYLGKSKNPDDLANSLDKLDQNGLSSYADENLMKQFGELKQKLRNKQFAKIVGASAIGAAGISKIAPFIKYFTGGH